MLRITKYTLGLTRRGCPSIHLDGVFPFSLAVAHNQVVGLLSVLLGKIVDAQFNAPLAVKTLQ